MKNRRDVLKFGGGLISAASLRAASIGGLGAALSGFDARAADVSGYRAIVCVFLFGGMDCHDTLIPYDGLSYEQFASIRAPLLEFYDRASGGSSRARDRLLPLTPDNAADFGGRQFALPEQLSGIHGLFERGDAAIVSNVGPLIEPVTRAEWTANSRRTPTRLFSHNDQQSTWVSSAPEGAPFGWGGRFADAALAGAVSADQPFATIGTFTNGLFLTGNNVKPYQVSTERAIEINALSSFERMQYSAERTRAFEALRRHFLAEQFSRANLIERDIAGAMRDSLEANARYAEARAGAPGLATRFPQSFIGDQLRTIAEAISIRDVLGQNRQVFLAGLGGFDTHSDQASDLPALHAQIDAAVVAFYDAMNELGVGPDVTLFTASDFGRTFAINGDGTDHGWGGHHFVVGGSVNGRTIYGDVPPAVFGHDFDAGGGRLIPTTSVEQMAAPMGRWFGLSSSELNAALPNLKNFPTDGPAFLQTPVSVF